MSPVSLSFKPLESVRADALVVLLDEKLTRHAPSHAGIARHVDAYARAVEAGKSRAEWFCTLEKEVGAATEHLLLDSASFGPARPGREGLKCAAARAVEVARRYSLSHLAFALPSGEDAVEFAAAVLEGALIGDFADTRFKSQPGKRPPLKIDFVAAAEDATNKRALRDRLARVEVVCDAVNFTRQLVNAPSNVLYPETLAEEARSLVPKGGGKKAKASTSRGRVTCEVLDEKQLRKQGYNLIEAVGRGSQHPPRLIVVSWNPPRTKKGTPHIALLGKGICFDTGGLSIKTGGSMHTMNGDMGGAGAVLGAMKAIIALALPVRVTAVVPAAYNAIDAKAYAPGNIIKSKSGKTVYVENTDAEGRLVLADGMARVGMEKPDILIDLATLTGAAQVALGTQIAALFSDDDGLTSTLRESSRATGDELWPMPLFGEYEELLAHPLADMNNIAGPGVPGGAITAALFLKAFVPDGVRWAHIDMSASARSKSKTRYYSVGATGWGVRLLVDAVEKFAE